jgi:ribose 5-phosphate isomerase B
MEIMIAIGSDHGGFDLKSSVIEHLKERGIEYRDFGCFDKKSVDYPQYAKAVAQAVASGEAEKGIVICTTGIGVSIAANKVRGIRCALCSEDSARPELTRDSTTMPTCLPWAAA